MINIEIVFALPTKATTLNIEVFQGTTAEQAVIQSGIIKKCPEIDATALTLARDHGLPLKVFNLSQDDALKRIACGEEIGTLIS